MKKKDYQLLLELTKQKMAKNFSLPKLITKTHTGSIGGSFMPRDNDTNSSKTQSQVQSPLINKLSMSRILEAKRQTGPAETNPIEVLSPIEVPKREGLQLLKRDSQATSPTIADTANESDSSDNQELQTLIAEGEGKLKKKSYQVSYTTGTKSILCKRFVKLGQCPLGKKCEYAHSKAELQFNSPQEWVDLIKNISQQQRSVHASKGVYESRKVLGESIATNGIKSLLEACRNDDFRGVEQLITSGISPVAQDFHGYDGLYYSVINNNFKTLKTLLEHGYDQIPTQRVYGKKKRNLLTIAAIYGQDDRILDFLLNNGIVKFNTNQTDRFQRNAIFYSLFRNNINAVRLFVNAQTSLDIPDLRGLYLLDYAQQYNFEEILLEVVKGGARLGIKQKKGVEIMMHAAELGNYDLIRALMSKNVPLTSISPESGQNCLMVALHSGKKEMLHRMIKYIINCEAFNQPDRDFGETLMMKAIQRGDTDIIQELCNKQGVTLGHKDKLGKTELIHAVEKYSMEAVACILKSGREFKQDVEMNHYDKRQRTAIIYAAINGNTHIMEMLLEHKFHDPNENHVIKWKDELGKDVCDYASTDDMKLIVGRYVEKSNMLYQNYFTMMQSLSPKYLSSLRPEQTGFQSSDTGRASARRNQLDLQALRELQLQEKMKMRSTKNKLKKIEDEISKEAERIKQTVEGGETEKLQILQQISKQRLKQLRTIAIKFPKLTNLEQNPKFKQAITQLYEESNLHKYKKDFRGRTVHDILENHSPRKVLQQRTMKKITSMRQFKNEDYSDEGGFGFPSIRSGLIRVEEQQPLVGKSAINIKDTLTKIFSKEQLHQYQSLTDQLNKDIEFENTQRKELIENGEEPQYSKSPILNLKEVRSKSTKNLRLLKLRPIDSDVENEIEDDIVELMKLYNSGQNMNKQVKKQLQKNFM